MSNWTGWRNRKSL